MNTLSATVPCPDDAARRLEEGQPDVGALVRLGARINRSLDLDDVLQSSLDGILRIVNGAWGCFLFIRPDAPTLLIANATHFPPSMRARLECLTVSEAIADASDPENSSQVVLAIGNQVRAALHAEGIQSFVLIPLVALRRAIGLMLVGMGARAPLAPSSVDLLTSIGEQVGMAIENARLHASLRESEEWHRAFIESSLDGFLETDLGGEITFVNDAACKVFECDAEATLRTRLADWLVDSAEYQRASKEELHHQAFLTNRLATIRTKTGKTKAVSYSARLTRDSRGEVTGYQTIFRDVTVEQQILAALRQRNEELAALNAIAGILSHPLEVKYALDQVCEQIASVTAMDSVVMGLLDETRQFLGLVAHRGVSDHYLPLVGRPQLDSPRRRAVLIEGKTFAVHDIASLPEDMPAAIREEGYHATVGVPLKKRGVPIGGIFVGSRTKKQYTQRDIDLLENISAQVSVALENEDLYAQMQRRIRELDGLAQLSAACAASLDPEAICSLAVEWTRKLLGVPGCSIRTVEDGRLRLRAVQGQREGAPVFGYMKEIDEASRSIIETQTPHVVSDIETDASLPPALREYFLAHGTHSSLAVSLCARNQGIGTLRVSDVMPRQWQRREIDLVQTIANQIAAAIDNAELFQNVLREQSKVQTIFDSGLSGLYVTDAEGKIVMFNRAAERITGWTRQELIGKKWEEALAHPAAELAAEPLIYAALVRKETVYVPDGQKVQTRDGRVIPAAKAVAPLLDEQGKVTGAVGAFWDLSREKAAEMTREHFLTMVAHQLRSPLTTLLSAQQLVQRRDLTESQRAELQLAIQGAGERLRTFADQFLSYETTLKSPRLLHLGRLPIVEIVRKLVREFRAAHPSHRFRVRSVKSAPIAYADLDRVEDVLRNLLDNAVSYAPAGTLVTISVKRLKDGMIDVAVQDQGPGIPVEEQEHIFDAFYRPANSAERRVYGHGLGLALARRMVKEMEGELWVESRHNAGATFHFTLPRFRQ
jgi:PAS domain S-box-containing protein